RRTQLLDHPVTIEVGQRDVTDDASGLRLTYPLKASERLSAYRYLVSVLCKSGLEEPRDPVIIFENNDLAPGHCGPLLVSLARAEGPGGRCPEVGGAIDVASLLGDVSELGEELRATDQTVDFFASAAMKHEQRLVGMVGPIELAFFEGESSQHVEDSGVSWVDPRRLLELGHRPLLVGRNETQPHRMVHEPSPFRLTRSVPSDLSVETANRLRRASGFDECFREYEARLHVVGCELHHLLEQRYGPLRAVELGRLNLD